MRRLAPTILCVALLAACGGGDKKTETTGAPTTVDGTDQSVPTTSEDGTDTTVAAGVTTTVGSSLQKPTITKVEDLSAECQEAVGPIRELGEKFVSGREIRENEDNVKFTEALANAEEVCTEEEFDVYSAQELLPWLNGPTQEELDAAGVDSDEDTPVTTVVTQASVPTSSVPESSVAPTTTRPTGGGTGTDTTVRPTTTQAG